MMRHHHLIKNREQSMLRRATEEIGMPVQSTGFWNHIQGKPHPSFRATYDRSNASLS
jgi:hypothetical protein